MYIYIRILHAIFYIGKGVWKIQGWGSEIFFRIRLSKKKSDPTLIRNLKKISIYFNEKKIFIL